MGEARATVRMEMPYELALAIQHLVQMGLDGSATALEVVPSVDVKTKLVERRVILFDLKDIVDAALYHAQLEMDT